MYAVGGVGENAREHDFVRQVDNDERIGHRGFSGHAGHDRGGSRRDLMGVYWWI